MKWSSHVTAQFEQLSLLVTITFTIPMQCSSQLNEATQLGGGQFVELMCSHEKTREISVTNVYTDEVQVIDEGVK